MTPRGDQKVDTHPPISVLTRCCLVISLVNNFWENISDKPLICIFFLSKTRRYLAKSHGSFECRELLVNSEHRVLYLLQPLSVHSLGYDKGATPIVCGVVKLTSNAGVVHQLLTLITQPLAERCVITFRCDSGESWRPVGSHWLASLLKSTKTRKVTVCNWTWVRNFLFYKLIHYVFFFQ